MVRRSPAILLCAAAVLAFGACSAPAVEGAPGRATPSSAPQHDVDGLVDVGDGRSIYAKCHGKGQPTVVLIAGKGNGAQDWQAAVPPDDPVHEAPGDDLPWGLGTFGPSDDAVFPSVARFTRVCTYDRPDIRIDESNVTTPRAQPHTVDVDVDDLHALMTAIQEPGPYVLVAHSYGGLVAALYARQYPEAVGGLVMVDTATHLIEDVASAARIANWNATNSATSPQVREGVELIDAFAQINAADALREMPAVVLSADKPWRTDLLPAEVAKVDTVTFEDWLASLELLAEALDAENITRTDSGHDIYLYNPALVVDEIHAIVDEVRADGASR